jgi:histidinol dehydrogenase
VAYGRALITRNLEEAEALVNKIAPEHVEIHTKEPNKSLLKITNAGAVFLGHSTPEVLGDYICGPSHTLPTGGTARFTSGLSCLTFLKRLSVIETSEAAMRALSAATMVMAQAEGLEAHRRAIEVRIQDS